MSIIEIFVISVALAMDAFSVSLSAGVIIRDPGFGHYFRLAFHFGLFQFFMPIIGYEGGIYLESYISRYDHWIAFGILSVIGIRMIWESFTPEKGEKPSRDPSRGMTLVMLSIATSIDALATGFSIGVLNRPILLPSIIIGITCALFSIAGVMIGKRAGKFAGARAGAVGGVMLILIAVKILLDHIG